MRGLFHPVSRKQGRRHRRFLPVVLLCLLSVLSPSMSGAAVSASIDRSAVSLNETIQLVLESDDKSGARPDLSALASDFEILGRRTSHQVSVINGRSSERHLLILRIRPRRVGEMRIPPIPFGEVATDPLTLSVAAPPTGTSGVSEADLDSAGRGGPASAPSVLVEADLEPRQGYVGEQFILTARVLTEGPISGPGPGLRDPQISSGRILTLSEDRYQAKRDGKGYRVYERRYALFPQSPGKLKIDPLVVEGWTSGSGMTPGAGYPSPGQEVRAVSASLAAEVLPVPYGEGKDAWLPARNLTLTELGPATYRAGTGQPIVRRISLRAEGIMSQDLPALGAQRPYQLAELREEPRLWDERRREGVIGNRQEVVVLRAQEPGHYRLPPVSLGWWDTATGRRQTASLPARDLVVSKASQAVSKQPSSISSAPRRPSARSDAAASVEAFANPPEATGDAAAGTSNPWIWVAVTLALAWTATMAAWWRGRHGAGEIAPAPGVASAPPQIEETDPVKSQIDAVRAAYQAGDAGAAREALLAWAERILPERTPSNLARLAQRCPPPLRDQVLLLERAFFSPLPVPWDKQPVWEGLRGFVPTPPEEPATFRRGKTIRRRAANPDAE
jgi:hypothetical protein